MLHALINFLEFSKFVNKYTYTFSLSILVKDRGLFAKKKDKVTITMGFFKYVSYLGAIFS